MAETPAAWEIYMKEAQDLLDPCGCEVMFANNVYPLKFTVVQSCGYEQSCISGVAKPKRLPLEMNGASSVTYVMGEDMDFSRIMIQGDISMSAALRKRLETTMKKAAAAWLEYYYAGTISRRKKEADSDENIDL